MTPVVRDFSCHNGGVSVTNGQSAYYTNLERQESDTDFGSALQGRDGSGGNVATVLPSRQANRRAGCECGCDADGIDWDNVSDEFVDRELEKIGFFKRLGIVPPHHERERLQVYNRQLRLKKQFGLTVEEYDRMFAAQVGVCAICQKPETATNLRTGKVRRLSVDHCHATGVNRGLLCKACNVGLGSFRDDREALIRAATYLTLAELLPPKAKKPLPPPPPSIREVQSELDRKIHPLYAMDADADAKLEHLHHKSGRAEA